MLKKILCLCILASISLCASQRSLTRQAIVRNMDSSLWIEERNGQYIVWHAAQGKQPKKLLFQQNLLKEKYNEKEDSQRTLEVPVTPR